MKQRQGCECIYIYIPKIY